MTATFATVRDVNLLIEEHGYLTLAFELEYEGISEPVLIYDINESLIKKFIILCKAEGLQQCENKEIKVRVNQNRIYQIESADSENYETLEI